MYYGWSPPGAEACPECLMDPYQTGMVLIDIGPYHKDNSLSPLPGIMEDFVSRSVSRPCLFKSSRITICSRRV